MATAAKSIVILTNDAEANKYEPKCLVVAYRFEKQAYYVKESI